MSGLVAEVREARSLPCPDIARSIRESAGVSQARLGAELGVHELTVHRWEAGIHMPRGAKRLEYARLLRELDEATHTAA